MVYPDDLKIAKIIPIFKNGRNYLIDNYRPISILQTFTKIMMYFIQQTNSIRPDQYRFLPNSGTEIAEIAFQGLSKSCDLDKPSSLSFDCVYNFVIWM